MAFREPWWHTDAQGRRVGWMDSTDFVTILAGYYGEKGWVKRFGQDFDIAPPTLYRYVDGTIPIPKNVAMIVEMLAKLGGPDKLPALHAPWLPVNGGQAQARVAANPQRRDAATRRGRPSGAVNAESYGETPLPPASAEDKARVRAATKAAKKRGKAGGGEVVEAA